MSPQKPQFNRGIWRRLEEAVRKLNAKPNVLETFVICGPMAGALDGGKLLRARPFRDLHHTASVPALVGGGVRAQPGECEYDEPLLSVLMGERMADEPDRVFEPNTILGAG